MFYLCLAVAAFTVHILNLWEGNVFSCACRFGGSPREHGPPMWLGGREPNVIGSLGEPPPRPVSKRVIGHGLKGLLVNYHPQTKFGAR